MAGHARPLQAMIEELPRQKTAASAGCQCGAAVCVWSRHSCLQFNDVFDV